MAGRADGGLAIRIVVLGCAGAGKTTFARRLAARLGAPAIVLDEIWVPGWGPAEVPAFREIVRQAHAGEAWVSDGNFAAATFDLRLPRAELIVWLDPPRWLCTARVFRRGEPHRPADVFKVLAFIRRFDRVNRPKIEAERAVHGPAVPLVRLTGARAAEAFLAGLDRDDFGLNQSKIINRDRF